ncbi:TonB-dependent receptor [Endozoicomonas sp. 4G]|uniref:TonB-dependent receptor n=1 Tax=Endozoicomonas sp. 4G TaxID=2872754 RepID=UPI0020786F95|nr:TonB-dependent receptor [Endozoicomonas sp. 4G]
MYNPVGKQVLAVALFRDNHKKGSKKSSDRNGGIQARSQKLKLTNKKHYKWIQGKNNNMFRRTALSTAIVVAIGASAGSNLAIAEEVEEQEVEKLEKVQVTGSRISRVDVEGPSPVVVISAEDIETRGFTDVFEALNSLNQNTGGLNQQNAFGFTPTAQAVNLRGLGVGRSLILIDGKRLPMFPLGAGGDTNFTDLGQIPMAAVERIEVLTDGASAIYGSDAMSGVVNVILKKDYEGVEVKAKAGDTHQGGYANGRVELLAGTSTERARATFIAQLQGNEILRQKDRDWAGNDNSDRSYYSAYSSYGATFVTSKPDSRIITPDDCGAVVGENAVVKEDGKCGYNRSAHRTLKPKNESYDLLSNMEFDLTEDTTAFTRLRFGQKNTMAYLEPVGYKVKLSADDPGNPTSDTANPVDGTFYRRLVEFGEREKGADSQYYGGFVGLNGLLMDAYDWEVSVGYTKQTVKGSRPTVVEAELEALVKSGEVDLLEPIPQSVVDQVSGESTTDAESSILSYTASLTGDLFELPTGTVGFATFAEVNDTKYEDKRDQGTLDGIYLGVGGTSGGGKRTQVGLGAEVLVPVLDNLEVTMAARYDDYNDDSNTGSAATPKVSFAYRPTDTVLVRGSWGKSFRAPDMQRLFGGITRGFNSVSDPVYCDAFVGSAEEKKDACEPMQINVQTGANRELEEETGTNYSFGVVWQAADDLTLSADWYKIVLKDLVVDPEKSRVIVDPDRYPGAQVIRNEPAHGQTVGTIDTLIYGPVNQAGETVEGIDATVRYTFPETRYGEFNTELSVTHLIKRETQTSHTDPVRDDTQYEPGVQSTLSLGWSYQKFSANVFLKYRSSFCSSYANEDTFESCDAAKAEGYDPKVDSMTTVNLSGKYRVNENASVGFGITNIADVAPPELRLSTKSPFYASSYDNPVGRAYYIQGTYKF